MNRLGTVSRRKVNTFYGGHKRGTTSSIVRHGLVGQISRDNEVQHRNFIDAFFHEVENEPQRCGWAVIKPIQSDDYRLFSVRSLQASVSRREDGGKLTLNKPVVECLQDLLAISGTMSRKGCVKRRGVFSELLHDTGNGAPPNFLRLVVFSEEKADC